MSKLPSGPAIRIESYSPKPTRRSKIWAVIGLAVAFEAGIFTDKCDSGAINAQSYNAKRNPEEEAVKRAAAIESRECQMNLLMEARRRGKGASESELNERFSHCESIRFQRPPTKSEE
jgi:hypothetical protein